MRKLSLMLLLIVLVLLISACAKDAEESDPADTVEAYMRALVAGDEDKLVSLACADKEADARRSAVSFQSANPSLEGMACKKSGDRGDDAVVTCEGNIVATYEGETRPVPLTTYLVTQVDDEWKWCGETSPE